jgi:hypothetical protein
MQSLQKNKNYTAAYLVVAVLVTGSTISILHSIHHMMNEDNSPKIGMPAQEIYSPEMIVSGHSSDSIGMPAQGSISPEMILIPN